MRYRYLRMEVGGRPVAILALAFIDNHPAGEIETWFSAQREVIKTQNGRIIGTAGLEVDWTGVRYPIAPPQWDKVSSTGATYVRERDQMPGYAFGLRDSMAIIPLSEVPVSRLPKGMPLAAARTYRWFQESGRSSVGVDLPTELIAWGAHRGGQTVVYSEQCLTPEFCLKLQRWPVQQ